MKMLIGFLVLFPIYICPGLSRNEYIENTNPTQYFVAGSAFTLHGGTFQYKNTCLFLSSLTLGLTDNVSFGVSTEFYRLIVTTDKDRSPSMYLLTPKIGFQLAPKLHVAVGGDVVFYREHLFDEEVYTGTKTAGLGYALLTYGTINNNLTVGCYAVPIKKRINEKGSFFNVSGIQKIGRKVSLVGESWFFPDKSKIIDGGFRFLGNRAAVDLGMACSLGINNDFIDTMMPYFDYTWSF